MFLALALSVFFVVKAVAQGLSEKALFEAAVKALQDGFFRRAEQEFSDFVRDFPQSAQAVDAGMLQMHARAEAALNEESYRDASEIFESIVKKYPTSARARDAVFGFAWSQFKLGESRKAFERLTQPDVALLKAVEGTVLDSGMARGLLLLAEVALVTKETKTGELALARVSGLTLTAASSWQRQFLTVRYQLLKGDLESAFQSASNLVSLARALPGSKNLAESASLQADVFLQRSNVVEALGALELNLPTNAPPAYRRMAMLRTVDLLKTALKPEDAIPKLGVLLKTYAGDPILDAAQMAMGEVLMRRFYSLAAQARAGEGTNILSQARSHLSLLVLQGTKTDFLGHAHYHLGWGWWEENSMFPSPDRVRGAGTNFDLAIRNLPRSTEQMVARFKLADTFLLSMDYRSAVSNYSRLLADYPEWATSKSAPHDQVLYQLARAWVGLRDLGQAREVSKQLTQRFPNSAFGELCLLLVAQEMNRQSPAAEAREVFDQLIKIYPGSEKLPEAKLGVAQTFEREERWPDAVTAYTSWLALYTNHPSIPFAEFQRASASSRSDASSNSFHLFTNFLARFPQHERGPLAQNWVGDYHFERGDFVSAEESYQRLYSNTNWVALGALDILYRAHLMAARSLLMRQSVKQAKGQLTTFISFLNQQTNTPPNVIDEAWFLLGDVLRTWPEPGRSSDDMQEAINAFKRIPDTSDLAPRAWGAIAGCHLALASGAGGVIITNRYHDALFFFQKSSSALNADIETRSLADYGIGTVFLGLSEIVVEVRERNRLQREALGGFLRVFYQKNRLAGESPVPYLLEQCGIKAVDTAQALGQTVEAASVTRRLIELFPPLRPKFQPRLDVLEKNQAESGK